METLKKYFPYLIFFVILCLFQNPSNTKNLSQCKIDLKNLTCSLLCSKFGQAKINYLFDNEQKQPA